MDELYEIIQDLKEENKQLKEALEAKANIFCVENVKAIIGHPYYPTGTTIFRIGMVLDGKIVSLNEMTEKEWIEKTSY